MGNGNALTQTHAPEAEETRSTDAIRRDIERRREAIAKTVDQAGQRLQQSLSWREHVREHPFGSLALAALAGMTLEGLLRRRPTVSEQLAADLTRSFMPARTHGLARTVGAALAAIATQAATRVLRERVVQAVMNERREEP